MTRLARRELAKDSRFDKKTSLAKMIVPFVLLYLLKIKLANWKQNKTLEQTLIAKDNVASDFVLISGYICVGRFFVSIL